jgi:hypothetical protein
MATFWSVFRKGMALRLCSDSDVACNDVSKIGSHDRTPAQHAAARCAEHGAPVDTGRLTNAIPNGPHRAQACLEAGPASARSVMTDLEHTLCTAVYLFESLLADAVTPVMSRARWRFRPDIVCHYIVQETFLRSIMSASFLSAQSGKVLPQAQHLSQRRAAATVCRRSPRGRSSATRTQSRDHNSAIAGCFAVLLPDASLVLVRLRSLGCRAGACT